jgi:hypothetical protein
MNIFRSVIEPVTNPSHPSAHLRNRRYRLRWDWHLRNALVAMLPPVACWLFVCWIEWSFEEEIESFRANYLQEIEEKQKDIIAPASNSAEEAKNAVAALQAEVDKLRAEIGADRADRRREAAAIENSRKHGQRTVQSASQLAELQASRPQPPPTSRIAKERGCIGGKLTGQINDTEKNV